MLLSEISKPSFEQFAMDLRCSPTGILLGEAADQIPKFIRDLWPAPRPPRSPAPIQPKAGAVPANDSIRLYDEEHAFPARPELAECNPEQSVERTHRRWRPFSFEDGDLLSQRDHFKRRDSARAKEDSNSGEERKEEIKHEP